MRKGKCASTLVRSTGSSPPWAAAAMLQARGCGSMTSETMGMFPWAVKQRSFTMLRRARAITLIWLVWMWGAGLAPAAIAQQSFALGPGDRLTVTVVGEPDLSGEFTIDNAGEITIPLLGPIQVAGSTLGDVKNEIVAGLTKGFVNQPNVFVRIAQPRPVYVLGDVEHPGVYPYQYGSVILTAVAQAGGYLRFEKLFDAKSQYLLADERVKVHAQNRDRLMIRIARLEAQLNMETNIALPQGLSMSMSATQRVIAEDEQSLRQQVAALRKQLDLLGAQSKQQAVEKENLASQIASERRQAALIRQRIEDYANLSRKGLARESTTLELNLLLASKESGVMRLEVELSRLHIDSTDLDNKKHEAEAGFKKAAISELNDARQRLAELEFTLPSARDVREARLSANRITGPGLFVTKLTRRDSSGTTTKEMPSNSELEPGDIVEVVAVRPSPEAVGLHSAARTE